MTEAAPETTLITTPDGRTLCFESGGDPAGRVVVACNGTPNSRILYGPWVADVERRGVRIVGYDRPGYGRSTPQPGHTVADGAGDVRAIAESLGADRIVVWGISGGGPYALACAALLPDLVAAVATVGSIAPYGMPDLDYFGGMGDLNRDDIELYFSDPAAAREKSAKEREEFLAAGPEDIGTSLATLVSPVDEAVLSGDFARWLSDSVHDGLAPGDQGWWDDGVAHLSPWGFDLDAIEVPVKVYHGRHDRFVPVSHGEWLAGHVRGAEADISERDGHLTLVHRIPEVHDWLLARA